MREKQRQRQRASKEDKVEGRTDKGKESGRECVYAYEKKEMRKG